MANADGDDVDIDDDGSPDESPEDVERRRAADAVVVEKLRAIGFDAQHAIGQGLVTWLREAGAGTLIVLNQAQELFRRAARLGVGLPTPPPDSWPSEAPSLLNAAATEAAPRFVSTSLSTWSREGGASILTYFVNNSIQNEFKTMYGAYHRSEQARCDHEIAYDDEIDHARCGLGRSDELAKTLDRHLIEQAKGHMDPRTLAIFDGIGEGRRQIDIARDLGGQPEDDHPRSPAFPA